MLQEPHEPVPRLSDLLKYLAQPENEQIWAFLDIKVLLLPPWLSPGTGSYMYPN